MPDVVVTVARLREFLDSERDRQKLRDLLQHDREVMPGTAGGRALPAAPLDHRARGTARGTLQALSPSPVGGGTPEVHHVTATAVASQDIAAGGATVQWGDEADAPTERKGFSTFSTELASGAVGDIPIDLTGVLTGELWGEWASYRGCDMITLTLLRDGTAVGNPVTVNLGPVTSPEFDGKLPRRWNVQQGDHLRVELANGSGSVQTLDSATLVMHVDGTTPLAAPDPATFEEHTWTRNTDTGALAVTEPVTSDGNLLVALVGAEETSGTPPTITPPSGWTLQDTVTATYSGGSPSWRISIYTKIATGTAATDDWTPTAAGGGDVRIRGVFIGAFTEASSVVTTTVQGVTSDTLAVPSTGGSNVGAYMYMGAAGPDFIDLSDSTTLISDSPGIGMEIYTVENGDARTLTSTAGSTGYPYLVAGATVEV